MQSHTMTHEAIPLFGLEAHMTWNNTLFLPRTSLWTRKRDGYTLYFDT